MARLRRAVHFVPGANEKMLPKSLGLPADSSVDLIRKEEIPTSLRLRLENALVLYGG